MSMTWPFFVPCFLEYGFRWRKHISSIQLLDFGHYKRYMRYNVVTQHFAIYYKALQRTT